MSRPSSIDSRLAAWLEEGPNSGPDDALADALARVHSTHQRPGWLERLIGDTMETTWRARDVRTLPRLALASLIAILVLALVAGAAVVGSQIIRLMGPSDGLPSLAAALPPTACPVGTTLHSGDIATIAGTGLPGSSGDGGPATSAAIRAEFGPAVDTTGVVYFSQPSTGVIRRIDTDGTITTIAGTGLPGSSGDGGPATAATLTYPGGLVLDAAGNLYVPDFQAGTIRKIDPAGIISTVGGTGIAGSSGNGGPAVDAQVSADALGIGPDGSLYFDDTNNFRKIGPDGIIRAFAGTGVKGYSGDGGPAVDAMLGEVNGVAVAPDGVVYLGDAGGHRIRKVDQAGIITTFAGTGQDGDTGDGGPAVSATLGYPGALVLDPAGNLYVADRLNDVVRKIGTDGIITTFAGTGESGSSGDCAPASSARLRHPSGLAFHDGVLYIVDTNNTKIRVVLP